LTENASQGSINQQIFPLIPERFLSELPEPPLGIAAITIKRHIARALLTIMEHGERESQEGK
jgi:hypothetical protein